VAVFDRVAALLLGLLLLAAGVLVPAEIVHTAVLSRPGPLLLPWPDVTRRLAGYDWGSTPVRAACLGIAAAGLVLLALELKRRRPGLLTLVTEDDQLVAGAARRSVARALAARAEEVDGVSGASATLRRRVARVTATTAQRAAGDLDRQVAERLTGWLAELRLVDPPRVRVRIVTREDR
jgi:hypothetical protein